MQRITRVSGLFPIDEEAFVHEQIVREKQDTDFDYDGGFGEDEDLSDLTAGNTCGLHSTFSADIYLGADNDNDQDDDYDAKELAA